MNSIKFKIIFLLSVIMIFCIGIIVVFRHYEISQIELLIKDKKIENYKLVDKIIEVFSKDLSAFTNDYSYWDEVIEFMKTKDEVWSKENFEPAFDTYNLQHIYLFNKNFELNYSKFKPEDNFDILKNVDLNKLKTVIEKKWFNHFFIYNNNILYEIKTAPVQSTSDEKRTSMPEGYLIGVRIWNSEYIHKIQDAITGKIELKAITEKINTEFDINKFDIINTKDLFDFDNNKTVILYSKTKSPILYQIFNSFNNQFIFFIMFIGIIVLITSIFLIFFISKPIQGIDKALRNEELEHIKDLLPKKNEFGKIANLIKVSINQKQELRTEVFKRKEVEQELVVRNRELNELIVRDALTGLYNRRFFHEIIQKEAKQLAIDKKLNINNQTTRASDKKEFVFGVYMVDIDFFKSVNDTYGHDSGDMIIKQISHIFTSSVRTLDVVTRWGGEEFIIVLRDTKPEYISVFAEKLRKKVEEFDFKVTNGTTIKKTCSIGFTKYPFYDDNPDLISFEQTISLIDLALYYAKNNGRNKAINISSGNTVPKTEEEIKNMTTSLLYGLEKDFTKII